MGCCLCIIPVKSLESMNYVDRQWPPSTSDLIFDYIPCSHSAPAKNTGFFFDKLHSFPHRFFALGLPSGILSLQIFTDWLLLFTQQKCLSPLIMPIMAPHSISESPSCLIFTVRFITVWYLLLFYSVYIRVGNFCYLMQCQITVPQVVSGSLNVFQTNEFMEMKPGSEK